MSFFIKEMVKRKLIQLTEEDLLFYSKEYGLSISKKEAEDIAIYIKNNRLDPFKTKERLKMFADLEVLTSQQTASKARQLFEELVSTYGLEHLFR